MYCNKGGGGGDEFQITKIPGKYMGMMSNNC